MAHSERMASPGVLCIIVPELHVHDSFLSPETLSDDGCVLFRVKGRPHSSMAPPRKLGVSLSEFHRCTRGATAGNVELLLPPRQSRGNSHYISLIRLSHVCPFDVRLDMQPNGYCS
jgi:hypothetical protein